jgi:uncharacterized protein (TIGR00369 family)
VATENLVFGATIPFVHLLGFELVLFEGGQSVIDYLPLPEHMNSYTVTHGGACMTLLDVSMAVACRSVAKDMGVVTIEMKTSFMRPATGGMGKLTGKGTLLHRTKSMAFAEAKLYDAQGEVCAHSTGTFKYMPRAVDLPTAPLRTD